MIEIPTLVLSAWAILQPLLPIIATKASEEVGKTAVAEIWTVIKKKFDTKEAAKEALTDLLKNPHDADTQGAFRNQLKKMLEEDSSFANGLAKLIGAAERGHTAQVIGGGAIAQGDGAKAVGAGGIMIEGGISGGNLMISDSNTAYVGEKKKK